MTLRCRWGKVCDPFQTQRLQLFLRLLFAFFCSICQHGAPFASLFVVSEPSVFYLRKSSLFWKWKTGLRGQMVAEPHPEWSARTLNNRTVKGEAFWHRPICMHKKTLPSTPSRGVKMKQRACSWQQKMFGGESFSESLFFFFFLNTKDGVTFSMSCSSALHHDSMLVE